MRFNPFGGGGGLSDRHMLSSRDTRRGLPHALQTAVVQLHATRANPFLGKRKPYLERQTQGDFSPQFHRGRRRGVWWV